MSKNHTATLLLSRDGVSRAIRFPSFALRVLRGPDKGATFSFAEERVLVGTGSGSRVKLTDRAVSAVHCELHCDEQGLRLHDLGSRNGTWFEDRRVNDIWLEHNDRIGVGDSTLQLSVAGEPVELELPALQRYGGLIGASPRMRQTYAVLERAATSDATLLIQGETGTGKELAARAVHDNSPRRDRPYVIVDCGCLPGELAENELFGHEPGAYSGADAVYRGAFERANGGTLFLDEIGELPAGVQSKLLGALQRRSFLRLGGTEPVAVDVRIIAATHRPLEEAVNRGDFRADLFYRLAVLTVRLPPLRERREDIPGLVAHFLEELGARLDPVALERLVCADYRGNVRELRNAVERAVLGQLPEPPSGEEPLLPIDLEAPFSDQKAALLEAFERAYLKAMLGATRGNVSEAARRAGLCRQHFHDLLKRSKRT